MGFSVTTGLGDFGKGTFACGLGVIKLNCDEVEKTTESSYDYCKGLLKARAAAAGLKGRAADNAVAVCIHTCQAAFAECFIDDAIAEKWVPL